MTAATIAFWPHSSSRKVASVRIRCLAIVTGLQAQGVAAGLHDPARPGAPAVLVLSKRYDTASLRHALDLRQRAGTRLFIDLCDNHFYNPRGLPEWTARADALRAAVAAADGVIASTAALAAVIRQEVPAVAAVRVVGDLLEAPADAAPTGLSISALVEAARIGVLRRRLPPPGARLIWFGNHASPYADGGMADLLAIAAPLGRSAARFGAALTIVSNSRATYRSVAAQLPIRCHYLPWAETSIARVLRLHDAALIPITRNPFTLCKTNNRVVTAFAHGLDVVADSIPSYEPFADAARLDDWAQGLEAVLGDPSGRAGRVERGNAIAAALADPATILAAWRDALGIAAAG
jgi:hypothetical protein